MEEIGDIEGALFWHGNFKAARSVSFRQFMEIYQSYLINVFLFKRISDMLSMTLLRHTLFTGPAEDDAAILASEVTVAMFGLWLRRYGPLKETLCKAAAFSLPASGEVVPWFAKGMGREASERRLTDNLIKFQSSGIRPYQAIIIRYSSDRNIHFVVTTKPGSKIEHFPIVNGPMGYAVVGEEAHFSPTIIDCLQYHIFDKLLSKAAQTPIVLSRASIEQWNDVFTSAAAELPKDHYLSVKELNKAIAEAHDGVGRNGASIDQSSHFSSLFDVTDACGIDDEFEQVDDNIEQPISHDKGHNFGGSGLFASPSVGSDEIKSEAVIGRYMIEHGVMLLQQAGELDSDSADVIRSLLEKRFR